MRKLDTINETECFSKFQPDVIMERITIELILKSDIKSKVFENDR